MSEKNPGILLPIGKRGTPRSAEEMLIIDGWNFHINTHSVDKQGRRVTYLLCAGKYKYNCTARATVYYDGTIKQSSEHSCMRDVIHPRKVRLFKEALKEEAKKPFFKYNDAYWRVANDHPEAALLKTPNSLRRTIMRHIAKERSKQSSKTLEDVSKNVQNCTKNLVEPVVIKMISSNAKENVTIPENLEELNDNIREDVGNLCEPVFIKVENAPEQLENLQWTDHNDQCMEEVNTNSDVLKNVVDSTISLNGIMETPLQDGSNSLSEHHIMTEPITTPDVNNTPTNSLKPLKNCRIDFSTAEILLLENVFKENLEKKTYPKRLIVRQIISENPVLKNRTVPKIISWIQYRHKKNQ